MASSPAPSGADHRIRVVLADDTRDIRVLLRLALTTMGGFEIVGEADNGAQAVALTDHVRPDATLLDLSMPVMDGLQAVPEIRLRCPATKIVILSGFSRDNMEAEALEVGADAYLEKGAKPQQIAATLLDICRAEDTDSPS